MCFLKNNSTNTLFNIVFSQSRSGFSEWVRRSPFVSVFIAGLFWISLFQTFIPLATAHSAKTEPSSLPVLFSAPEISQLGDWINSKRISSMKELRGKVILVDFWTYSCFNCINTFSYVQSWHEKYAKDGLVVLGIHAPEFQFERKLSNVKKAVKKHGLTFPIALDNGFKLWRAYRNRYWPAFYLIDKNGVVRYSHFGEGRYRETEAAIISLLKQ
jgi:thiol-disulfide isomerase/thioredoxin